MFFALLRFCATVNPEAFVKAIQLFWARRTPLSESPNRIGESDALKVEFLFQFTPRMFAPFFCTAIYVPSPVRKLVYSLAKFIELSPLFPQFLPDVAKLLQQNEDAAQRC